MTTQDRAKESVSLNRKKKRALRMINMHEMRVMHDDCRRKNTSEENDAGSPYPQKLLGSSTAKNASCILAKLHGASSLVTFVKGPFQSINGF